MFMSPSAFTTNADIIDILQPPSFLPDGNCHPPGTLVVFETVARNPGGSPGKLNIIENY
jgi:hypothetical protein